MSFIDKIKQWFGIGGVKVKLQLPSTVIEKNKGQVTGSVVVTTKSNQHVNSIKVEFEETYTVGSGQDRKIQYITMGSFKSEPFDLAAGETKTISFAFPFSHSMSMNQKMQEKGGVLGAMGSLASMADRERSSYAVKASADVQGAIMSGTDVVTVSLK